jgi:hypothetical protein
VGNIEQQLKAVAMIPFETEEKEKNQRTIPQKNDMKFLDGYIKLY